MIILEIYKRILECIDLTNISYGGDLLLCGISLICILIDVFILMFVLMLLIRIITKRPIKYWIEKYMNIQL